MSVVEGFKHKVADNIGSRLNSSDGLIACLHQYGRLHRVFSRRP
jgi:hypothetical protein